jgi:hypothetical protein
MLIFKGSSGLYSSADNLGRSESRRTTFERLNCDCLKQVRRVIAQNADLSRPILFQITGQSLGGAFAQNAAHVIKMDFPEKLDVNANMLHVQVVIFSSACYLNDEEDRDHFEEMFGLGSVLHITRVVDFEDRPARECIPGVMVVLNSEPAPSLLRVFTFWMRNHSIADLVKALETFKDPGLKKLREFWGDYEESRKALRWTTIYAQNAACAKKKSMAAGVLALTRTGTGLHGPVDKNSFVRRLTQKKIHNFARWCQAIEGMRKQVSKGDLEILYGTGLMKERDKVALVELRDATRLYALMIEKGSHRNKFLIVFSDQLRVFTWSQQDFENANAKFLRRVVDYVKSKANPRLPILFQCTGHGLGGGLAQCTAWNIKTKFPGSLKLNPSMLNFHLITFNSETFWKTVPDRYQAEATLGKGNMLNIYRKCVRSLEYTKQFPGIDLDLYALLEPAPGDEDCHWQLMQIDRDNGSILKLLDVLSTFEDEEGDLGDLNLFFLPEGPRRKALSWTSICKARVGCKSEGRECCHFDPDNDDDDCDTVSESD